MLRGRTDAHTQHPYNHIKLPYFCQDVEDGGVIEFKI